MMILQQWASFLGFIIDMNGIHTSDLPTSVTSVFQKKLSDSLDKLDRPRVKNGFILQLKCAQINFRKSHEVKSFSNGITIYSKGHYAPPPPPPHQMLPMPKYKIQVCKDTFKHTVIANNRVFMGSLGPRHSLFIPKILTTYLK